MKHAALLAIVLGFGCNDSKPSHAQLDKTKLVTKKYSFEAYPEWSMVHADKMCPDKISDLDQYMKPEETKDAWGNAYRLLCGATLPAGAKGVAVFSAGPDGKDGTADDIKAWE